MVNILLDSDQVTKPLLTLIEVVSCFLDLYLLWIEGTHSHRLYLESLNWTLKFNDNLDRTKADFLIEWDRFVKSLLKFLHKTKRLEALKPRLLDGIPRGLSAATIVTQATQLTAVFICRSRCNYFLFWFLLSPLKRLLSTFELNDLNLIIIAFSLTPASNWLQAWIVTVMWNNAILQNNRFSFDIFFLNTFKVRSKPILRLRFV